MHKFHPLQIMFQEIVEGRGCYINPRAVCERDYHFHLLILYSIQ